MKAKKFLRPAAVIALAFLSVQSFAYVIYNNTNYSVQVNDKGHWFGGISRAIPPHGSVSCKATTWGCNGNMDFRIKSTNNQYRNYELCSWTGTIAKDDGDYFVISSTSRQFPSYGSCKMEYFHKS